LFTHVHIQHNVLGDTLMLKPFTYMYPYHIYVYIKQLYIFHVQHSGVRHLAIH